MLLQGDRASRTEELKPVAKVTSGGVVQAVVYELGCRQIASYRDVILIMQDTGMRPQDVFRMRWEHLNWFKRELFIPYGKTKNSRRYVPLSERVIEALELRGASPNG